MRSLSWHLPGVVAGRVENSEDNDGVAFDPVEELVWKAPGQDTPVSSVVQWKAFGRFFQAGERVRHAE